MLLNKINAENLSLITQHDLCDEEPFEKCFCFTLNSFESFVVIRGNNQTFKEDTCRPINSYCNIIDGNKVNGKLISNPMITL